MNRFAISLFVVALIGAAQCSFFPFMRQRADKPDAPNAAAYLNAFFGIGTDKTNFNDCKGVWREAYLQERLEAAVKDFAATVGAPDDMSPEASGFTLLVSGVF